MCVCMFGCVCVCMCEGRAGGKESMASQRGFKDKILNMFENEYKCIVLYKDIPLTDFSLSFSSRSLSLSVCVLLLTRKWTFGMKENDDSIET